MSGGYHNLGQGGTPSWGGTPSHVQGTPPEIASTCYGYAAGGVPLAFTQEDFLVVSHSSHLKVVIIFYIFS